VLAARPPVPGCFLRIHGPTRRFGVTTKPFARQNSPVTGKEGSEKMACKAKLPLSTFSASADPTNPVHALRFRTSLHSFVYRLTLVSVSDLGLGHD
jgi:hypothetical protein